MATIHAFRPVSRSIPNGHAGTAEIIIFPGVRYEYGALDPAPRPAKPKRACAAARAKPARVRRSRRIKRDFLEISA
jgi:hypothetical protein